MHHMKRYVLTKDMIKDSKIIKDFLNYKYSHFDRQNIIDSWKVRLNALIMDRNF